MSRDDENALDAIAWYLRAQREPGTWRDRLEAVIDSNEDHCMATEFIKDRLFSQAGGAYMIVTENRFALSPWLW